MRRTMPVVLAAALFVSVIQGGAAAAPPVPGQGRLAADVAERLDRMLPDEMLAVIVTMRDRPDPAALAAAGRGPGRRRVITGLQTAASASQAGVRAMLQDRAGAGIATRIRPLWVTNAVAVTATADVIRELAARSDVAAVNTDEIVITPSAGTPEPNIAAVNAPALWDLGVTGDGVVVANLDSGVDASHPDLAAQWRGGTNSWFDPFGQHPATPIDLSGHGTAVMGVMVGADGGGTSIGMAPGAQWIAARIFDDSGASSVSAIHAAFEWLLDPDGNPATDDAPDVVNASWAIGTGPGCDLVFQPDVQALRAAGIVPVFAAGNFGPGLGTGVSPANYPESFAVGAIDGDDSLYWQSSQGPSACGESETTYPDIVAPGVDILTSQRTGLYQVVTGTSIAAPHVAGALALLLSADPTLSVEEQETALRDGATDLGQPGPDNDFGHGALDVLAAYELVAPAPPPTRLYFSVDDGYPVPGVAGPYDDADIYGWDGDAFSRVLDGSAAGLPGSADIDAIQVVDADTIYMSFDRRVEGLGSIDVVRDEDIVLYDAGEWSLFFDGSDGRLGARGEDVDAFSILDDGSLVVSTRGPGKVPGIARFRDEDLIRCVGTFGPDTTCAWSLYFDGSDVGLTAPTEDVDGAAVTTDGIYLTTRGHFSLPGGTTGSGVAVILCSAPVTGANTACGAFSIEFDGSGSTHNLDAIHMPAGVPPS